MGLGYVPAMEGGNRKNGIYPHGDGGTIRKNGNDGIGQEAAGGHRKNGGCVVRAFFSVSALHFMHSSVESALSQKFGGSGNGFPSWWM